MLARTLLLSSLVSLALLLAGCSGIRVELQDPMGLPAAHQSIRGHFD